MMIRLFIAAAVLLPTAAPAQVTSYVSNNAAKPKGDPNRIVCRKDETIGTRLGAKKVCLTIEQWQEKHREQREFTEEIQSGTWGARSNPSVEMQGAGGAPQ